ncbi:MAG TPA: hypothetical protein VFN24_09535 [Microbacterium sp.]|nr:hypothetical protein [Microbacterium sp.]
MPQTARTTWSPSADDRARARVTDFMRWVGEHEGVELTSYRELWTWSVDDLWFIERAAQFRAAR